MFELVPSDWMRKYLREQCREFSDWERAALIWNAPNRTLSEKLEALKELECDLFDDKLKAQIKERLEYEDAVIKAMKENPNGKFVYVVIDNPHFPCGFFADYESAVEYAVKYSGEYDCTCLIQKHEIISKNSQPEEYNGYEIGGVSLNETGEMRNIYSSEISQETVDTAGRFENHFFRIPFGMDYGCVKDLTDNTYGVLANNNEGWERYMEKWENGNYGDLEFGDIQVMVFKLMDNGIWSHEHINPLYLEPETPEEIEGDEKQAAFIDAANALVDYFKNETEQNSQTVIDTAKAYSEVCHRLFCEYLMKASTARDLLS